MRKPRPRFMYELPRFFDETRSGTCEPGAGRLREEAPGGVWGGWDGDVTP